MKILHFLSHSVPHLDGFCVRSANIVKFQKSFGWEPAVVTSTRQEPVPSVPEEVIDGIKYYRTIPRRSLLPLWCKIQPFWQTERRIEQVLRDFRPQVIHAHSPSIWARIAARAARRFNIPFVYEVRWIWEDGAVDQKRIHQRSLKYRLAKSLESSVARSAEALVTISDGLKRDFCQRGIKDIFVVPNGVDTCRFRDPEDSRVKDSPNITIGYVGSLYSWEGVEDLVSAAAIVSRSCEHVCFQIVGDGEAMQRIASLVETLSLSSVVQLVGRVPHSEIERIYNEIDILVYPRRSSRTTELVTPLKPLEAMALGKPIIISDVGGHLELASPETAAIYSAGNSEELAEQCIRLVQDRLLRNRLGSDAQRHVQENRDWERIIQRYEPVYAHAVARRNI
ncbi:GDP-mannose-dependent alpha-mannosyltransferase [Planctomycetes bacterium CA13]|uniref:GDP-mannose-dependent alpha-mannosyltransferase n=1 Tax=Novipirellula herctigrandis TaxID=2527986 RepID=A0A5C5Z1A0_9BACT|nr:GDP-mannose-dependent alpha-mannosyltransferase [Planctomycetes bacterium CA13]